MIRLLLIISIIVVVSIALIAFGIILYKVYKIKQEIKKDRIKLTKELEQREGEQKLLSRNDFGQPIQELKNIEEHIDHEIVEFCINSIIRNEFKNVLMIGNVGLYESIGISNRTGSQITVLKDQFKIKNYDELKEHETIIEHKIDIIDELNDNFKEKFDAILLLNNFDNFDKWFGDYQNYLKTKGMFIISNTKKNKKNAKLLESKIQEFNYKYDMLKWHKGFALIVKTISN